jgi:hypothetical protein
MAGVTHRVAEVFEILDRLPENYDRKTGNPETGPVLKTKLFSGPLKVFL